MHKLRTRCARDSTMFPEVTIVLERGIQSIAAVHAVMLEGCAYNAFDIGEPAETPAMQKTQGTRTLLQQFVGCQAATVGGAFLQL